MAKKKNLVKSIILIVLGALMIPALFLAFWKVTSSYGTSSTSATLNIFGKDKDGNTIADALEIMGKDNAEFAFNLSKTLGIIAIVLGIAIIVFEVLKLANIDLSKIEKIIGIVLVAVTGAFILFAFVFFVMSTFSQYGAKTFFSTAFGFYLVAIPGIVSGILAINQ